MIIYEEKTKFLNEFMKIRIPVPQHFVKKPLSLKNGMPINKIEHPNVESLFILSVIWGNSIFLRDGPKSNFHKFLIKRIRDFDSFQRETYFANNFFSLFKETNLESQDINVIFLIFFKIYFI